MSPAVFGQLVSVPDKNAADARSLIAVDLTPLVPGGESGGAAVLALELIARMRKLAPRYRILLLTSPANHQEIDAVVDRDIERHVVQAGSTPVRKAYNLANRILSTSRMAPLGALFSRAAHAVVGRSRWLMQHATGPADSSIRLRERGVDLLFCPFTAPIYAEPGIRVVSILYDLQHLEYPQFFTPEEVAGRNTHLAWLRRWSDLVICISEHSRRTLVERVNYPIDRTRVVSIAIHDRFRKPSLDEVGAVKARFGLHRDYVLYPANGWPHKNHRLLLAAFGLMRARHPHLDVDLVLTGAMDRVRDDLVTAARRMGLQSHIHLVGYCTSDELAALYEGCRMVVFPSLYEGFGIPVMEAMWFGKPVACSRTTSLPEVGGDAARYFDPRRPEDIASAMQDVLSSPGLAAELVTKGRKHAASFSSDAMAAAYVSIFDELLLRRPTPCDSVAGVFVDGWTSGVIRLAHAGGARTLEIELEAPSSLPDKAVTISLNMSAPPQINRWQVQRGRRETLQIALPVDPDYLTLEISPLFRPSEHGLGNDSRLLGCLCRSMHIVNADARGPNLLADGVES